MSKFTRRQFIYTAGATAAITALANGCSSEQNTTATTNPTPIADTPEVTTAKLGFIALTDAAPLIIAKEKGFFAKYGMPDVEVLKQASWGVTRDNLVLGSEGGH
jgi:nitrate/nitrite transport system substrate-binding protein